MSVSGQREHQTVRILIAAAGAIALLAPLATASAEASTRLGTSLGAAVPAVGPHLGRAVSLRLPLNAGTGTAIITSSSCVKAGSCALGGVYSDSSNVEVPMAVTESGGHWARAIALQLPADAESSLGALVESVSCTRVGSCVAVGDYRGGGLFRSFIATESHGVWHKAIEVKLPLNAGNIGSSASGVSCTGPGSCVLVGDYSDGHGNFRPMAAKASNGKWARAKELRSPPNVGPTGRVILTSVSCPKPGACAAAGLFDDKTGKQRAMAITESAGTWHRAIQLVMPKGALADPKAAVNSVSCKSPGNCVAVGNYRNQPSNFVSFSIVESGGAWAHAQHFTRAPVNASSPSHISLQSVACTRVGTCTASGSYLTKFGNTAAMIATRSGGKWVSASQVRLPAGSAGSGNQIALAKAIGCSPAGFCAIGGTYRTASLTTVVMAASG